MDRRCFLGIAQASIAVTRSKVTSSARFQATRAVEPSSGRLRDMLGVNVHFIEPIQAQMNAVVQGGFHWARVDCVWSHVERSVAGAYDFSEYDVQFEALRRNGISPYAILCYGNRLYDDGRPPAIASKSHLAFLRFVEATTARYSTLVQAWEVWNEPNTVPNWKPYPDAQAYAALCRDTCAVIRRTAPSAVLIAGATAGIDITFLQRCAQLGALEHVDLVSVHPYRTTPPETALAEMRRLDSVLEMASGRPVGVIAGEWGYSTANKDLSPSLQAAYYARMMLSNFASKRPITVWYDLEQDGSDPTNIEHNFGMLVHKTKTPLPAFVSAMVLSRLLGDGTLASSEIHEDGTYVVRVDNRGIPASALWASAQAIRRTIEFGGPVVAVDMMGSLLWKTMTGGTHPVDMDPATGPVYVLGADCEFA